VFPIHEGGHARVLSHLLQVRFTFVESSIYVEEERKLELWELQESISIAKYIEEDGYCWYLTLENYKAYRLPLSKLVASIEILSL